MNGILGDSYMWDTTNRKIAKDTLAGSDLYDRGEWWLRSVEPFLSQYVGSTAHLYQNVNIGLKGCMNYERFVICFTI